jgi:hypothetical protein
LCTITPVSSYTEIRDCTLPPYDGTAALKRVAEKIMQGILLLMSEIFGGIQLIVFFMGRKDKLDRRVCVIRKSIIRGFQQVFLRRSNLKY